MEKGAVRNMGLGFRIRRIACRHWLCRTAGLILIIAAFLVPLSARSQSQVPSGSPTKPAGSYFVAYRTPGHVRSSKPEVFHDAAEMVMEFLGSKHVLLVSDPDHPKFQTEELFSIASLVNLAKNAGGTHLLYLTVDRPASKWLKLTVECYDLDGKLLWQESADSGMGGLSGKNAPQKTMDKLEKQLSPRLGGAGLTLSSD